MATDREKELEMWLRWALRHMNYTDTRTTCDECGSPVTMLAFGGLDRSEGSEFDRALEASGLTDITL